MTSLSTTTSAHPEHDSPAKPSLWALLGSTRKTIAFTIVAGFISAAFGLLPPIAVTILVMQAVDGRLSATSAGWALGAIAVGFILSHLLHKSATGHAHVVEARYRRELRQRILIHLARLPLGWHSTESSGRVRTLVEEDVKRIHTIIAHFGSDFGLALGTSLFGLAYLFTVSWQYALIIALWLVTVLGLFSGLMSSASQGASAKNFMEAEKDLSSATVEVADGISTVKAFGLTTGHFQRFTTALDRYTNSAFTWMREMGTPSALATAMLSPAGMLVPTVVSGWILLNFNIIQPIIFVPFVLIAVVLPSGLQDVLQLMYLILQGRDAAIRIGQILAEPPLPQPENPKQIPLADGGLDIAFEGVSFAYAEEDVLRDITLRIPGGSVTAIVGPSGSGKSTLVRLIARFWDVGSGVIRIGGTDIRDVTSSELLSHLAVVLQEGGIMVDTVRANIALGRPGADDDSIERAAKQARIHDRILQLPSGYDTVLGTDGAHLSGGEAQRIALARAFLADAPILLLDEATAQADPHSERRVQEAIAELAKDRTVVVIAHRLSTVVDADKIVVLDDGRLVEEGTHSQLLAADGRYRQMWEAQQ